MSLNTIGNHFRAGYRGVLFVILCMVMICFFIQSCILSGVSKNGEGEKPGDPAIESLSIVDGQVVRSRDITIQWQGNREASLYQYTFDNVTYNITPDTVVTMTDLEESAHTFVIRAYNESQTKLSEPDSVTFTVDAVQGPGIVFSPRKITSDASVSIFLKNVNNLMAAHIELFCENRCVLFGDFVRNESLVGEGTVIAFTNTSSSQRLILDIAFAGETGGLSGSMIKIGTVNVTLLRTGAITVDTSTIKFRDITNTALVINNLDFVRVVR